MTPARGLVCLCLIGLLALGACSPADEAAREDGWQDALERAQALERSGDGEAARFALRRALRDHPQQPELHIALARNELARGSTELALTSIDDASRSGANVDTVALLRAQTYLAAADQRALDAMPLGPPLTASTDATLRFYQAQGLIDASATQPDRVFERFFALFRYLDALGASTRERLREQGVDEALKQMRTEHAPVAQAWAHVRCADTPVPPATRWQPMAVAAERRVLRVGPGEAFATVAAVAAAARDGDVIDIAPGEYAGDVAIWSQNGLLIRGVGERPHIRAAGKRVRDRDVWLFRGNDITIENVEISGARSPKYRNGAAIRHIGRNLTLRHVFLHDSENGLLTGNDHPDSRLLIEHAEFSRNGRGDGLTHNIYVGQGAELTLRYSYSHDTKGGHLVKSRAARTQVLYSRLTDEQGLSSYLVDTPNGGEVTLLGSILEQGAQAQNKYALSYAGEGTRYESNFLRVVNNTLYNRAYKGVFAHLYSRSRTYVVNNIAIGAPTGLVDTDHIGFVRRTANLLAVDHGVRDPARYDFDLTARSPAIDAGEVFQTVPTEEYVHPLGFRPRQVIDRVDLGAYEACRGALPAPPAGP